MQRKALGKGLEALFSKTAVDQETDKGNSRQRIINISLNDIIPNRNQPRERFSNEAMENLKQSIAENGIIEPPVVRRKDEFYELIAGERRFRAAKELNFETIDVILMDVDSDDQILVLSLIENIQREDLNAIEEGKAYQQIMNRMGITQEKLAGIVGKSRSTVANMTRLLSLSKSVQMMVCDGLLAPGSARALIPVQNDGLQYTLARKIAGEGLSARKAEELVKRSLTPKPIPSGKNELSPFIQSVREELQRILGTEVKIKGNDGKGKVEIEYYSQEDLERILETLKGEPLS